MKKYIVWLFIFLVFLIPIYYFFSNISDQTYRNSALGNWFATMIGVIIGIPIALEINRLQLKRQNRLSEEKIRKEEKKQINLFMQRIYKELSDDSEQLAELRNALGESKSARTDLWAWAMTIVESFSFVAYIDFQQSNLQRLLPQKVDESVYLAYKDLRDVLHQVKQAAAAHEFYYGFRGDGEQRSNKKFAYLKELFCHISLIMDQRIDEINKYIGDNKEV